MDRRLRAHPLRRLRSGLWFAAPGQPRAIPLALVGFAIGTIAVEVAAVFNNAMIPRLVPPERLGRLSGTGWAIGYLGGLVSLVIVLGFLAGDAVTGKTFFGIDPLFELSPLPQYREGDRITGPFSAIWFLVFVMPLFFFTPDRARSKRPAAEAVREGLRQVQNTIADARRHASVGRFLIANMVYQDALVALFAFGGIYGAGVFGWRATELGIFGILLTVTGTLGALIGGRLDDLFGAKPVIMGAIVVLALVCVGVLSLGREHILFGLATAPAADGDGLYGTAPEKLFLALGLVIGAVAGPLQASSRIAPRAARSACRGGALFRAAGAFGKSDVVPRTPHGGARDGRLRHAGGGAGRADPVLLAGGLLMSGVKRV